MSKIKKIKKLYITSRKAGDKFTSAILSALISEGEMIGKNDGNRETTDQEMVSLILKFKKNVEKNIELLKDEEQITKSKEEVLFYESILPQMLSKEEMISIIKENNLSNIGMIMGFFKNNKSGEYDTRTLSEVARSL